MSTSASRVATFGTTIFTEVNTLAQQYNALNLGQGKPDFDAPQDVIMQLVHAAQSGRHNQYAPGLERHLYARRLSIMLPASTT